MGETEGFFGEDGPGKLSEEVNFELKPEGAGGDHSDKQRAGKGLQATAFAAHGTHEALDKYLFRLCSSCFLSPNQS